MTLEHLAADARCRATYRPDQMQRVFDLVHLKYLAPMLSPAVMDYLIRQSMLPDTTSRQIIDGIWSTFTRPSDGRAGGLKHYLAGAVALLDLAYGAVQHLHRFAGLYAELRFQGKLDVSLNRSPNRMTVKHRSPDGRPPLRAFASTLASGIRRRRAGDRVPYSKYHRPSRRLRVALDKAIGRNDRDHRHGIAAQR